MEIAQLRAAWTEVYPSSPVVDGSHAYLTWHDLCEFAWWWEDLVLEWALHGRQTAVPWKTAIRASLNTFLSSSKSLKRFFHNALRISHFFEKEAVLLGSIARCIRETTQRAFREKRDKAISLNWGTQSNY